MKKLLAALVLTILAGCEQPAPPPKPDPNVQRIQLACDKGDLEACKFLAELRERNRDRAALLLGMGAMQPPAPQVTYFPRMK